MNVVCGLKKSLCQYFVMLLTSCASQYLIFEFFPLTFSICTERIWKPSVMTKKPQALLKGKKCGGSEQVGISVMLLCHFLLFHLTFEACLLWFTCVDVFDLRNLMRTEEKTSGRHCQSYKKEVGSLVMKVAASDGQSELAQFPLSKVTHMAFLYLWSEMRGPKGGLARVFLGISLRLPRDAQKKLISLSLFIQFS